jgi:hypothetical protein
MSDPQLRGRMQPCALEQTPLHVHVHVASSYCAQVGQDRAQSQLSRAALLRQVSTRVLQMTHGAPPVSMFSSTIASPLSSTASQLMVPGVTTMMSPGTREVEHTTWQAGEDSLRDSGQAGQAHTVHSLFNRAVGQTTHHCGPTDPPTFIEPSGSSLSTSLPDKEGQGATHTHTG